MMPMMPNPQSNKFITNIKLQKRQASLVLPCKIVKLLIWLSKQNQRRPPILQRIILPCVSKNRMRQAPKRVDSLQDNW